MKADWRQIEEVFLAALEEPAQKRQTLVETACGDDAGLRDEVLAMLRSHEETADFLETPAYQANAELLADESGSLKNGEQIGDYRIVSLLGEGGMGEVYLADDLSLGRKVALKLVRPGFGGANLLRQFQREERILAGLTHPNIAQLYGGAVTAHGVPFFVMEYVEGQRLDAYCENQKLSVRNRLELFRKICAAVSYAHRHLVIHRDLKPANIRVNPDGEPKLLDFGIARLLEEENAAAPAQTITITSAMTPDYASPEQLRGESMTTSTDVYSLGVVLFELLTGQKPYRTKSRRIDEVARAITEQEPTKPSNAVARDQKSEIRSPKLLRGDLDNIVLTAIRKEPARRYSSVGQFAEDIRRHLDGLPIRARKDTLGYRTTKFIGRNRIAVAAAILVALAILSGLVVSLWEAKQAREQRDVAQRINSFLQNMLSSAAPEVKGVDVKVADLLNDASTRARTELAERPDVMAEVLLTLGGTYISIGLPEKAEADLRAALEASRRANGELHPTTAKAMGWLGLALAFRDKGAEGEQVSRQAVALHRKLHPAGDEDLGVALYALGSNLILKNEARAARPYLEEAVELIRKHKGEINGYHMASLTMLARAEEQSGDTEAAEKLYHRAIEIGGHAEARYRIFLAQAQAYLGFLLINKGAFPEAEAVLRESEAEYRQIYGSDANFSVGSIKSQLALIHFLQGDYALAEPDAREGFATVKQFLGLQHAVTTGAEATLGLTLTRLGKATEAEPYLREVLAVREKTLAQGDPLLPATKSALGECLTALRRFDEAEPLLLAGYNELKAKLGDQHKRTIDARERLAKLYTDWNKPVQAARFR
jgi:serine/threonine-protein kinase